ncbi:DAR GTPase 3, chloroplastic-like isoform X2 [Panicum virgatum]|uniref:DAR GTPase 3, chloroplastic-like isoform X2 n=1 Tax=Panicum virgatum TaxID=38727 RepID=UPI0019D57070|nr:DAR GTPase 3, chloroplastic-like isoform X2 [Panicum virgatum]
MSRSPPLTPEGRETAQMACVAALLASPALLPFPSTASSTATSSCSRPAVVARAPRQQPRGRRALRRFDEVEGVSKKRRGIGGGASGAAGSQASSPRRDRGLAVDFKESQVRGASNCFCFVVQVAEFEDLEEDKFLNVVVKVAGDTLLGLYEKERLGLSQYADESEEETYWETLDADLRYWTRSLRPVQWYPGHIAKTEKELKEQLRLMDVVIEIRDARIPLSTSHPKMDSWLGNRRRIIVLNREDMISTEDRNAWATYFANQGTEVVFANGQLGMGTMKLGRMAKSVASGVNTKRKEKGLLPRPVRAGIVGYPNVGKSSLINRLLKRRMCPAAPRPGVTRELKWVHFGTDLELLDSPGILPMRISDQTAAIKLAICDDIGERSYDFPDVAAILVQMLIRHPAVEAL